MNIREWALPVYTILTQMAVGALFVLWVIRTVWNLKNGKEYVDQVLKIPILIILVTAIAGIIGAHFHLSKPYLSFLALLNFKSSWLSREVGFNLIFIILVVYLCLMVWSRKGHNRLIAILGWLAILFGLITEYCMSRIYILSSQPAWDSTFTPVSFFTTMLLLGVMAIPLMLIMDSNFSKSRQNETQNIRDRIINGSFIWLAILAFIIVIAIAMLNYFQKEYLQAGNQTAQISAELLLGLYSPLLIIRYVLQVFGVGLMAIVVFLANRKKKPPEELMTPAFSACLMVMIAEILGRFLFFAIHVRIGI